SDETENDVSINPMEATTRQKIASLVILFAFGILLWGILKHGWYFRELSGLYVMTGVVVGLIGGLTPSQVSEAFVEGFKKVLLGATLVGLARGVAVVLDDGN